MHKLPEAPAARCPDVGPASSDIQSPDDGLRLPDNILIWFWQRAHGDTEPRDMGLLLITQTFMINPRQGSVEDESGKSGGGMQPMRIGSL